MAARVIPVPEIKTKFDKIDLRDIAGGGYRTHESDTDVPDNCLTGGRNVVITGNYFEKRTGPTLYGSVTGFTTSNLGTFAHEPPGGTAELLRVYDTVVERYVSGIWTALTSVTMTTNKPAQAAYFPLTGKTYIVNGTDNVVKYTSGASGDQSDASFKKGKYIKEYKNRLITAGVTGQTDYFWYTDLGVDTFSANNYVRVNGEIIGLDVLYDKLLIFTKNQTYVVSNFTFNGVAAGPEACIPLRGQIGLAAPLAKTICGNLLYFLSYDAENVVAVQVTDALTIANTPVSQPIAPDFGAISPTQIGNACMGSFGQFIRLSITPSGASTNTLEYIYDTVERRWFPPYTNQVGGYSCYTQFTISSQRRILAGTQNGGITYLLDNANYDEAINQSYTSGQDTDGAVDANPALRAAQSFELSVGQTGTYKVTGVALLMKKNTGTTTDLTVRIETNSAGVPSGTLADANLTGTITAFSGTSYTYRLCQFATPADLTTDTTYWITVKHATEGSGTSQYYWGYDGSSPTYASGNGATYASGSWTAQTGRDYLFVVFYEADIDGYADTKSFYPSPQGQLYHLRDFFVTADASGPYTIQVGVNTGEYSSYNFLDMDVSSSGPLFGSTLVIGQSVLGGKIKSEMRLRPNSIRGHTIKFRFRDRFANHPFAVYGWRTRHEILSRMK